MPGFFSLSSFFFSCRDLNRGEGNVKLSLNKVYIRNEVIQVEFKDNMCEKERGWRGMGEVGGRSYVYIT